MLQTENLSQEGKSSAHTNLTPNTKTKSIRIPKVRKDFIFVKKLILPISTPFKYREYKKIFKNGN